MKELSNNIANENYRINTYYRELSDVFIFDNMLN